MAHYHIILDIQLQCEGHLTLCIRVLDSNTENNRQVTGFCEQVPAKDHGYTLARQDN